MNLIHSQVWVHDIVYCLRIWRCMVSLVLILLYKLAGCEWCYFIPILLNSQLNASLHLFLYAGSCFSLHFSHELWDQLFALGSMFVTVLIKLIKTLHFLSLSLFSKKSQGADTIFLVVIIIFPVQQTCKKGYYWFQCFLSLLPSLCSFVDAILHHSDKFLIFPHSYHLYICWGSLVP